MPSAGYKDAEAKNRDKDDPEADCAIIQESIEGGSLTSLAISASISPTDQDNVYTLAAARVGSKSFTSDGVAKIFTREALEAYAHTWKDGIITLNHDKVDDGQIISAWFDDSADTLFMDVLLGNEDTRTRVDNGEPTGVSIEADLLSEDDSNNITAFGGTGVGIIFYPEQPACPTKDGCGILASRSITAQDTKAAIESLDSSTKYDLVVVNNTGAKVKLEDVTIWNESGSEEELKEELMRYATWKGPGKFYIYPPSDMKVGDVVTNDIEHVYEINLLIAADKSISSIDKQLENGGVYIPTKTPEDPAAAPTGSPEGAAIEKELAATKLDLEASKKRVRDLEAGAATKELTDTISARDATIVELQEQIDTRDTAVAATLVTEIQAHDEEFLAEGQSLEQIKMVHATVMRISASLKASEEEDDPEEVEEVEGTSFKAPPAAGSSKNKLTVGGIQGGVWQSEDGKAPLTAKVPGKGDS